jgi:hypothetical protein
LTVVADRVGSSARQLPALLPGLDLSAMARVHSDQASRPVRQIVFTTFVAAGPETASWCGNARRSWEVRAGRRLP